MRLIICGLSVFAVVLGSVWAGEPSEDQTKPSQESPEIQPEPTGHRVNDLERQRFICCLKNRQANELAEVMHNLMQADGSLDARVIPDPSSNQIIVTCAPKARSQVMEMLSQLDRPPAQIHFEFLILQGEYDIKDTKPAEIIQKLRELRDSGQATGLVSVQVRAISNQHVKMQLGNRRPVIMSTQMSRGGRSNSVSFEDVGCLISFQPVSFDSENIILQLEYESSYPGTEADGVILSEQADGDPVKIPNVYRNTVNTILRLKNGQPEVVRLSQDTKNQVMIAITGTIVPE
ncbi:MAG: hypothetical protein JW829_02615 [Pirellulales bacterium]|nr:hypothetical protein [Pirellulales bacterium]